MKKTSPQSTGGFTLIELLVVVAIIALLVSILVPSLGRAKELAKRSKCQANLHAIGLGWQQYWTQDIGHPGITAGVQNQSDPASQDDYFLGINGRPVNAGVLAVQHYLDMRDVFVCHTIDEQTGAPWWCNNSSRSGAFTPRFGGAGGSGNWWPLNKSGHSRMCYGTRRMMYYEDASLAGSAAKNSHLMLCRQGVGKIPQPSSFSFMADCFNIPFIAEMSHVPGVEVLYMDGHVSYFKDPTDDGSILYANNGIANHSTQFNWQHDMVWMNIDEKD